MDSEDEIPDAPVRTLGERLSMLIEERLSQLPAGDDRRRTFMNAARYAGNLCEHGAGVTLEGRVNVPRAVVAYAVDHGYGPKIARTMRRNVYDDTRPEIMVLCAWLDENYKDTDSTLARDIRNLIGAVDYYLPDAKKRANER